MDQRQADRQALSRLLETTPVRDVMTSPVVSIRTDEKFSRVVHLFNDHRIRHLPVINTQGQVVGIVTQRDLYKIQSPRRLEDGSWYYDPDALDDIILGQVMNTRLHLLTPDQSVSAAVEPMVKHKYGCLVVVDKNKKPAGIITQYDLLEMAYKTLPVK
ncbi:MAG: HPP family protein [Candidatus Omnitrophota bacterium]